MAQSTDEPTLLALPPAERLRLIELLWDSLDSETVQAPPWHEEVLRQRLAEYVSDPSGNLDWKPALEALKAEFRK